MIMIPLAQVLVTATVIMIIVNFYKNRNKKVEGEDLISKYLGRILNKSNILFRSVLFMPLFHIILAAYEFKFDNGLFPTGAWTALASIGLV